jgi:MFS family permease
MTPIIFTLELARGTPRVQHLDIGESGMTPAKLASAPAAADAASPAPASAASPWPVFWVACVATFLVSLDTTMLYSVFSALRAGFPEASAAEMSWTLNAYTVVYAAMLIPAGGLADTHGRKRVFMSGVALFIAASAMCGLASSVGWLIAARALQAVGAALLTPASLSIVLAAFPQSRRAVAVSLWGAVGGFAAAVGPSLGSLLAQTVGWAWAFFINLPIGALTLWWAASLLGESDRGGPRRRVDLIGMALIVIAVGAIALAIVEAESANWTARSSPRLPAPAPSRCWPSSPGQAQCANRSSTSGCSATGPTAR